MNVSSLDGTMGDGDPLASYAARPRSETVRHIRKQFGVTQAQLAAAMGTSTKAIQSYEQGWRNVPTRVLIQLLVLLAIHRRREVDKVPCWEIRHCPPEKRDQCASYMIGDGQLCWFVTAGTGGCGVRAAGAEQDDALLPCMTCEVIQRLLRNASSTGEPALPERGRAEGSSGAAADGKTASAGRAAGVPAARRGANAP